VIKCAEETADTANLSSFDSDGFTFDQSDGSTNESGLIPL
jgi:hypothetical protein